ncbi:hypothetical protein BOO71_0009853 [Deinococcus marmoris]|uniref:Uncharacterized protein n=1 Tax=Deinococcus marmoris TaxID=249408 RepID=A0A1U7NVQ6_9DEIO|nr:hypothetical protein BOO71_0009853 [Deinococcus marmoris]
MVSNPSGETGLTPEDCPGPKDDLDDWRDQQHSNPSNR